MWYLVVAVVAFVGGAVFDHLFFRANKEKAEKVDMVIDEVAKKL